MHPELSYDAMCTILWLRELGGSRTSFCLGQILRLESRLLMESLHHLAFLGMVFQSDSHERWTCVEFPSEWCMHFLKVFEPRSDDLAGQCIVRLADRQNLEGCLQLQTLMERLLTSSRTSGAAACLELLIQRLREWDIRDRDESTLRQFIDLVLMSQSDAFFLGFCMKKAHALSEKADAAARALGDLRAQALINLVGGCLDNLSGEENPVSPVTLLRQGLDAITALGDADIKGRVNHFLSTLHYIQGDFRKNYEAFDEAQHATQVWNCRYFNEMYPIYICPSALYLGLYPQAVGAAVSALRTAEIRGERHAVLWWHTLLAVMFLRIGLYDLCLEHLAEVMDCTDAESNPKLHLWVWRTLAAYHAETGSFAISHKLMRDCLLIRERFGHTRFAYTAPWIIELFAAYEERGFPPLPGYAVEEELGRILRGPNRHLHGMAYRIQAQRLEARSGPSAGVVALLENSRRCFLLSENRREVARTTLVLARHLERQGRTEEAAALERQARAELEATSVHPWRLTGHPLQGSGEWQGYVVGDDPHACLERCLERIGRLEAGTPLDNVLYLLVNTVQRELGAERAVLLRQERPGNLCYLWGSNLTLPEYNERNLDQHIAACLAAMDRERSLLAVGRDGVALCAVLGVSGDRNIVLYIESSIIAGAFVRLGAEDRERLFSRLAHELSLAFKIEEVRKIETKSEQERARAVIHGVTPPPRYDSGYGQRITLDQAKHAAHSDAAILIMGETGVGKEVLAHRIHQYSGRTGAFVPVHPASTPETLFESEFFGHEKGAFTGAVKQKIGLFELANGGTFFIDEIGELPLPFQVKLLRVLQDHTFMRVGGTRAITSEFRLVAATNRDLWAEVQKGRFREDLYYRICVIPITIPPLRERRQDIPGLARMFIDEFAQRYARSIPPLGGQALETLLNYPWPGNLRELKNVIERAVILSTGGPLEFFLGQEGGQPSATRPASGQDSLYADLPTLRELNIRYMRYVLGLTGGKVIGEKGAERILGIKRSTLYAKLHEYGLK